MWKHLCHTVRSNWAWQQHPQQACCLQAHTSNHTNSEQPMAGGRQLKERRGCEPAASSQGAGAPLWLGQASGCGHPLCCPPAALPLLPRFAQPAFSLTSTAPGNTHMHLPQPLWTATTAGHAQRSWTVNPKQQENCTRCRYDDQTSNHNGACGKEKKCLRH